VVVVVVVLVVLVLVLVLVVLLLIQAIWRRGESESALGVQTRQLPIGAAKKAFDRSSSCRSRAESSCCSGRRLHVTEIRRRQANGRVARPITASVAAGGVRHARDDVLVRSLHHAHLLRSSQRRVQCTGRVRCAREVRRRARGL
jgi:hypothetical protein